MKMQGKVAAAFEWAKTWEPLNEFLKLNAILNEDGDASFATASSSVNGEPYIDGTAKRDFIFMLKMVLPWSDGHDPINLEANALMEKWRDWVDEQFPNNIPAWDCEIEGIEALSDVPTVTVYQDESLAEYNFQAKITYIE